MPKTAEKRLAPPVTQGYFWPGLLFSNVRFNHLPLSDPLVNRKASSGTTPGNVGQVLARSDEGGAHSLGQKRGGAWQVRILSTREVLATLGVF